MPSLEEMAEKGKAKLSSKAAQMQLAYHAANGRAVRNYQESMEKAEYQAPDPEKWARNWLARMRE